MSLDLIISFDDTGSMSSIRYQLRNQIRELMDTLFRNIDDLRVAFVLHNDHGDRDRYHATNLTSDREVLNKFLEADYRPGGYGNQAAYELVLQKLPGEFAWREDAKRLVVMIGDEVPNRVHYFRGFDMKIDWKAELQKCIAKNIKFYGVQCFSQRHATSFYEEISNKSGGKKLDLSQFAHVVEYVCAAAFAETNEAKLEEFEASKPEFSTNFAFRSMFDKLRGRLSQVSTAQVSDLSKFQVLKVGGSEQIDSFVRKNGLTFKKGRGFYELSKSEEVQESKEVLLVNRATGETIGDTYKARQMLGLPYGTRGKLNTKNPIHQDWRIFIQSTSMNRKLDANTDFLYELELT